MEIERRFEILRRDGYRCTHYNNGKRCVYSEEPGIKNSNLTVHHITEKVKFKNDPDLPKELGYACDSRRNLTTLCSSHHVGYHSHGIALMIDGIEYKSERMYNFNWRTYKKEMKEVRRSNREDWARVVPGHEILQLLYWLYVVSWK